MCILLMVDLALYVNYNNILMLQHVFGEIVEG